jgi:aryl-alcohol dehydrogenase-like predicted oxidoreductase
LLTSEAASKIFKVVTVQNRYNLVDRGSEDVLDYCEEHGVGFIPWFPLAAGRLAEAGSILDAVANAHSATPGQIALAWYIAPRLGCMHAPLREQLVGTLEELTRWRTSHADSR